MRSSSRTNKTDKNIAARLLRRYGIGGAVAIGVIGTCGLATATTRFTDKLAASPNIPPAVHVSSAVQPKTTPGQQEATELTPIATTTPKTNTSQESTPVNADTSTTSKTMQAPASGVRTTTLAAKPICDNAKQAAAKRSRSSAMNAENTHHRLAIWALQSTGAITRSLNPSMYNYRMSKENSRHQAAITNVQKNYALALRQAHC